MNRDELRTERLVLRRWTPQDRKPFAAMNADPDVMEYFPEVLDRIESDALVDRIEAQFDSSGFGRWALEIEATCEFIGYAGLSVPHFDAPFTPAVEVGWRLARSAWGRGYATEAAGAALDVAFGDVVLVEVVSFTSEHNLRSQRVMQKPGMSHDHADDFESPLLPVGHRLRSHVLYRITADSWQMGRRRRQITMDRAVDVIE
jgi:RimJ/RimL family protein N-acetyltransferase